MALAQVLLPLLARHPHWVAAQLSERLQRPVSFASLEGRWQPSGPLFVLHDVSIGDGKGGQALHVPESELKLDFGGWLLPSRHLLNLHVRGLQLDLGHAADGSWHVNGVRVAGGDGADSASLGSLSLELWLSDLRLDIADAVAGKHYGLVADQLRLSRHAGTVRVGLRLRREGIAGNWRGAGSFREDGSAGRLWLAGDGPDLHALLGDVAMDGYTAERGGGSLAVWLDWKRSRIVRGTVRADLADLVLGTPSGKVQVPALHAVAAMAQRADGYDLRLAGDDGSVLAAVLRRSDEGVDRLDLDTRRLRLGPLLPWLALKPGLPAGLARWLGGGHPRGVLEHARVHWSRAHGLEAVDASFDGLGIDPVGKLPGVGSLHGELRGDAGALALALPAQASVLRFPHTFRKPFAMSKLAGDVVAWPADGAWHIGTDAFDFAGEDFAGQVRGEVALPDGGGRPFLDLYARLDHADVQAAKLFWPLGSMSPAAIEWLDRALVAGTVDQGDVLVRGSLADWPFRHNEGRFEARAAMSGLTLDYGKGWPRAEGVAAVASFVNNGMLVEASGGQALGVAVDKAVALIPDFADSTLDLNVQGNGSGASLMGFVRKSPIAARQADALSKLSLGGSGTFDFHLSLPLKDVEALTLQGSAQLRDADLSAPDWKLRLDKLAGPLQFDAKGLHAGPLDAGFRGQPSRLDLKIATATGQPDTVLSARLDGNYSFAELLQDLPSLGWLGDAAQGRSAFAIGFDIAHAGGSQALTQTLSVDSSLEGIALDFPTPLKKAAPVPLPLHLSLPLPVEGSDLQIALGPVLRGRFRLPANDAQPLAGTLAFGSVMPETLPDKGLRIRGHAARMDMSGWVQRTVAGSGEGGVGLESIEVGADQAELFGKNFGSMHVRARPQADALGIDVESATLTGHFDVPTQDLRKRGVTARLQQLYMPKENTPSASSAGKATAAAPQAAGSAQATAGAAVPAPNPAATGIDPASLPPFHLWIGDLRLGEAKLGEARLETWPTAKGMHIDQLRALSKQVQINAGGDWNGTAQDSHTRLRIDFAAENLGSMLNALGFEGLFEGGKTRAELDASWPGAPSTLALANMDGKLGIQVSNGRIPDVGPGVGRLFGLISVAELPRRLTLDFGDVFGKGLGFDSITGDFRLADGNATTDNLKIAGPAAEISIKGRTGLRAKDYDQQVQVVPHVGNSLPVVGAVVAGPVGAAAGLAVQGLLGHGLNKAAGARYRITGSWDKPVITLVEKHAAATPAAVPAPASSAASR
ncbi:hypothetical protein ASG87_14505 [Frateuria sp. Soil773]|nr:hypothetical protein ASG87_14505 [Frateuria sp. Soil773]